MAMNRRCFLQRSLPVMGAASLIAPGRSLSATLPIPIVDTHQHLWDLSQFKLRWLSPPLDRSFTLQDYTGATAGLGVVKAVYMEVAVAAEQRLEEAQYVIKLCRQPDCVTRAAVIAGSPAEDGFEQYITRFKGSPFIKGVRGGLSAAKQMSDRRVIRNLRLLGDLGMRFDLNVSPSSLPEAAQLVEQCPDTRFVLDHCGNADPVAFFSGGRTSPRPAQHSSEQRKRDIDKVAAPSNVVCKISGIVSRVRGTPLTTDDLAPIINHCLDAFGPDRVVFAGDWPVCLLGMPLRDWVQLLKEVVAHRPEKDQRKLFHDNAVGFYGL